MLAPLQITAVELHQRAAPRAGALRCASGRGCWWPARGPESSSSVGKPTLLQVGSNNAFRNPGKIQLNVLLSEPFLLNKTAVFFCEAGLWLGIKLDKPSGKNDGSVGGVRYFSCPLKHGVFAPPSRVQR